MYNSFIVGGLVNLWNIFLNSYDKSLLKKIIDKPKNLFSSLYEYSNTKSILTSKDSLILKSVFYKIFSNIVGFVDKLFGRIHKFFIDKSDGSLVYKSISSLFKTEGELIKTIYLFILSLLVGMILNGVFIFDVDSRKIYTMSVITLILIGISGFKIWNNYKEILDSSLIWRFIRSLFKIDEGGERWW